MNNKTIKEYSQGLMARFCESPCSQKYLELKLTPSQGIVRVTIIDENLREWSVVRTIDWRELEYHSLISATQHGELNMADIFHQLECSREIQ